MAINTLPKSTGKKRGKKKAAKKPQLPPQAKQMTRTEAYAQAKAQGKGKEFLLAHPKFAEKIGKGKRPGLNKVQDPDVRKIAKDEKLIAQQQAQQQIGLQNATVANPYGSAQTTMVDGKPVYTETLAPEQQEILNRGQDLTQAGQAKAAELVGGYEKFGQTGSPGERARIEDAVYQRLTRNVDRDYNQEFEEMEQRMYNRGIPLNPSDPAYKREMDALNEKYSSIKENAAQNAVSMGGQELSREFGMGLQSHQQGVSDMGTLQQQGTGLQGFQGPGFQAPTLNQTAGGTTALTLKQQQTAKEVANINANAAMQTAQMGQDSEDEDEDDGSGLP